MASRFPTHAPKESDRSHHASSASGSKRASSELSDGPVPLTTSKNSNGGSSAFGRKTSFKKQKTGSSNAQTTERATMDDLIAKLAEQKVKMQKQKQALMTPEPVPFTMPQDVETSSVNSVTPASDRFASTPTAGSCDASSGMPDAAEFLRLKQQLARAQEQIAHMGHELTQQRSIASTIEHAMGPPSEADVNLRAGEITEQTISQLQHALNSSMRPIGARQGGWTTQKDSRSDESGPVSAGVTGRDANIWSNMPRNGYQPESFTPFTQAGNPVWNGNNSRPFNNAPVTSAGPAQVYGSNTVNAPVPRYGPMPLRVDTSRAVNGYNNDPAQFHPPDFSMRRNNPPSRPGSAFDPRMNFYNAFPVGATPSDIRSVSPPATPLPFQAITGNMYPPHMPYQPRPIGTRLSPTAAEFHGEVVTNPWNAQPSNEVAAPNYIPAVEPLNYRRLLDRNASCNWAYIVEKITCNNDQQASIFLQQKLKSSTADQKHEIVEAIIAKAFPLMVNRFGNFLVQRCFEHGTHDQVIAIANAIRGNTLQLSMDAFGCHVIQKAFDCVPEEYKAIMVHELLRRIPETVVHRYACHVWQKLFELRWSDSPPQIMRHVNEALRGMWHEVAMGETGSLVVQNIFENCLEEDKRPCINEVLASIDIISHGQFGNWCIQHICEHGAPADRSRAIDHILRYSTEYSMDQYASKVIEKCLKIGGNDFMDRYLDRVCEGRPDRPRMPLIDIAGDQFGNYLIQWILTNANPQHRDLVATHVRKHMVSLRGSKYGSRVAMLCCNPMSTTRPGPPAGMQLNRYNSNQSSGSSVSGMGSRPAYGGAYR